LGVVQKLRGQGIFGQNVNIWDVSKNDRPFFTTGGEVGQSQTTGQVMGPKLWTQAERH
jgi:hypothetical protein